MFEKSLKCARRALKDVRRNPEMIANYEEKIQNLRNYYTGYTNFTNEQDYLKLNFLEMGLKVEDQILLQIAWIHQKLSNYEMSLETLLKIHLDYINDTVSQPNSNVILKTFVVYQCGKICQKLKKYFEAKEFFLSCCKLLCSYLSEMGEHNQTHRLCDFGFFFGKCYVFTVMYFQAFYMVDISIARIEFKECQEEASPSRTRKDYIERRKKIRLKLNSSLITGKISNCFDIYPITLQLCHSSEQFRFKNFLKKTKRPKRENFQAEHQRIFSIAEIIEVMIDAQNCN